MGTLFTHSYIRKVLGTGAALLLLRCRRLRAQAGRRPRLGWQEGEPGGTPPPFEAEVVAVVSRNSLPLLSLALTRRGKNVGRDFRYKVPIPKTHAGDHDAALL